MEQMTIVKRRSRLGPVLLMLILLALLVAAAFWVVGDRIPVVFDFSSLLELGRTIASGTA
jgi:hypothetical protein